MSKGGAGGTDHKEARRVVGARLGAWGHSEGLGAVDEVQKYWKVWSREVMWSYFLFKRISGICFKNRM